MQETEGMLMLMSRMYRVLDSWYQVRSERGVGPRSPVVRGRLVDALRPGEVEVAVMLPRDATGHLLLALRVHLGCVSVLDHLLARVIAEATV